MKTTNLIDGFDIHATSNPYFHSAQVLNNKTIIVMAVDQLYVNRMTNDQKIVTEYYEQEYDEAVTY